MQYSRTRHNAAWMLLESLQFSRDLIWREKFHGKVADYSTGQGLCRILLPETFMNKSGVSVSSAAKFYKLNVEEILVIHDDLELPFGQYSLRTGGGLAGHNGLKSIRDSLGSSDFRRLRLGIGRPDRGSVHSWVLSRFSPDEEAVLSLILEHAANRLDGELSSGDPVQNGSDTIEVYPN